MARKAKRKAAAKGKSRARRLRGMVIDRSAAASLLKRGR